MAILINGILFGLLLSFLFGPAFFLLLETSIKKGFKSAFFLDIGILLSDAIYLLAAFFVAEKINIWLTNNDYIKYIAGLIFVSLGINSIVKNYRNMKRDNPEKKIKKELDLSAEKESNIYPFNMIIKGIGLNAINPGVLVFWIAACTYATEKLKIVTGIDFAYYFGATLSTVFFIDLLKIYFSSKLNKSLNNWTISLVGLIIGCVLVFFGIAICLKDIQV